MNQPRLDRADGYQSVPFEHSLLQSPRLTEMGGLGGGSRGTKFGREAGV